MDVPFLIPGGPLALVALVATVTSLLGLLVGAGSLVLRYRRARGVELLQLRWMTLAAAMAGLAVAIIGLPLATGASIRATGSTTWTGSSAAPWPTRCSRSCSASATPPWSWAWAGSCPTARAWPWPRPPWP